MSEKGYLKLASNKAKLNTSELKLVISSQSKKLILLILSEQKFKRAWNTIIFAIFIISIKNVQYVTDRIPAFRCFESFLIFL